ncbi:hypothetical protein HG535_0D00800 [Zygotorulaspora mrakii]|uniref:RIC1 C-terminal alpha solenoid region domain-containing protein n=1 Tax=Zygotorulaspora mrakii TaxID=42260 RepID=A0A7H9B1G3_ZYGMR|nr:uncharacterized protein HG535_0D00800 [Zygotorulaspora mrakii]QLG72373.1 hypothetical protein HG535_0D00800 [Zygotorulaspora mrakii]
MTNHLWPLSPPQRSKIGNCISVQDKFALNNNDILQTVTLPQTNVFIMVTPSRILIYNLKPMAHVSSHERTGDSIREFGLNKSMTSSVTLDSAVEGLLSDKQINNSVWNQGKLVFYVMTDKNFLLTYQILKDSSNMTVFKAFGIPVVDLEKVDEEFEHEYDDSVDDDTLTVFEKNKSSKVIQNGYAITKEQGFLQFLSNNQENLDELPVKKLELRLKVVLKVDYQILDLYAFKRLSEVEEDKAEESLLVLFPHGLQLLTLVDFRLKSTSLVEITHGKRICINQGHLLVVSQDQTSDPYKVTMNHIDMAKQHVEMIPLEGTGTLLNCFTLKGNVAFASDDTITYYNPTTQQVTYRFQFPFTPKYCCGLNRSTILAVSQKNYIYFYTELGNLLFSNSLEDDNLENATVLDYSAFSYLDMTLIATSHTGEYELWNLWEQSTQNFSDTRSVSPYVLHNTNNDIAIYTPVGDSSLCRDGFQYIKLPTRTINNCVSLIKVNPNMKLTAIYVANKAILLLYNLETNMWYSFIDITILDMHWIGTSYLLCQIKKDDWSIGLHCFRLRLQDLDTSDIYKYSIWDYELPDSTRIQTIHVNTLSKYKSLKLKARDSDQSDKQEEKYFKTAEINVVTTNNQILRFAVISLIHPIGVNIIRKIYEHGRVNIPNNICSDKIEWLMNFRDGLLYFSENKLIKAVNVESEQWVFEVLLDHIEKIVDVYIDDIFLICNQKEEFYNMDDLWDKKPPLFSVTLDDDCYPISISPQTATVLGLRCIFHDYYAKFVVKHKIYLDELILTKMEQKVPADKIMTECRPVRYFNFALEKILSTKILENKPLDDIIQIIKLCDIPANYEGSLSKAHSDMLEIVSNCLRKTEIKHWNLLFTSLGMTPRDLLARCLEGNEAKILGVLLIVFLNYDAELVEDLRNNEIDKSEAKDQNGSTNSDGSNPDSSVVDLIRDQEMMLTVLRLLVTSAANTSDSTKAADSWDMCFQLIRLLKELDKENNTQLIQKALDMFE